MPRTPLPDPALPPPDPEARRHSAKVTGAVIRALEDGDGWISFRDYMQVVLYAPRLGYYVAGARKLGRDGDFTTSPELTPLFGAALSTQVAHVLAASSDREVIELGAGTGRLAADMLRTMEDEGTLPARYSIVEISPDLRKRQKATIAERAPSCLARVRWLDTLPDVLDGALLMNEVLDAIPPHVIVRRDHRWYERGIEGSPEGGFAFCDRELGLDDWLMHIAMARFPAEGDYTSEINPVAEALIEDLGRRLVAGALVAIDYGFPRHEYYHPQRDQGTVMAHYRHRATADPFVWPGLADLTAHVDFTAIAEAGVKAGLRVAGFTTQAAFLVGCGLLDRLAATGKPESADYIREASAVQKLLSPAEMGELFKVIALARSDDIRWPGFTVGDMSHRL